nr:LysM peptidoglycan-binding domain-containing protein [uncultured Acetatifactor sp.]
MAIGYLIMQARTAHDAVPLSGIQVRVLDDRGNPIYNLMTDESGETLKVPLETLDKSFSQNQYFSGLPYLSYNVLAQGAGFNTLYITHIPIYDGETATLPLELVPMQTMQRRPEERKIFIGKPAVAMQETRAQEGEAEPDERVLRQVVIPNPITVHLGVPGSNAANVQVSFPNYVKNVASSEIYPTWPANALRANIYAIITFALNRIYTEWYRSRGYNYDITNSTAYDQYYVNGRPIYESISRVVDDIFNEYVRRQGQNAPYFTSFCNGTTVTCQGMSQWGTVTLAERGLTPLEILRSYYPKDIEIVSTDIITNVVTSYPGTALRAGSTGLNVETIQKWLGRVRQNYPAIPVITDETGTFGDSTREAVVKFQRIFGLSADGIVGKSTWFKLSSLYTAVTRLAELDSEGDTLGIGTVPPSTVLRQGSTGQDVITLQYLLDVISEYYSGIPAPVQDGIFGSGTQQSVIAFQRAMRLTPDGVVGPATWKKLYEVYRGIGQNVPMPGPSPEPSPGPGPGNGYQEYTVRAGDSLWLIAQRYHTTVDAIRKLNGLTSDLINVGQVLKIPSSQSGPYFEYTVRPGDTLWLLSRRYDTTVEAIKSLNGLTSDMLNIGQVLRIPTRR